MKKYILVLFFSSILVVVPTKQGHAVVWVIVKAAIKKAIMAIDLAIQRQQNKVIWLQNAQKTLENNMSKLKLNEISDWLEKQRSLYKNYFEELKKVKSIIVLYQGIREIADMQQHILNEYQSAYALFKKDGHFSGDEIMYMGQVYQGILLATARQADQLLLVVHSFTTQMTDANRLDIINEVADDIQTKYADLKTFTDQNKLLSLARAKDAHDINVTKAMYGL